MIFFGFLYLVFKWPKFAQFTSSFMLPFAIAFTPYNLVVAESEALADGLVFIGAALLLSIKMVDYWFVATISAAISGVLILVKLQI